MFAVKTTCVEAPFASNAVNVTLYWLSKFALGDTAKSMVPVTSLITNLLASTPVRRRLVMPLALKAW